VHDVTGNVNVTNAIAHKRAQRHYKKKEKRPNTIMLIRRLCATVSLPLFPRLSNGQAMPDQTQPWRAVREQDVLEKRKEADGQVAI
jgi:hypothetical protein